MGFDRTIRSQGSLLHRCRRLSHHHSNPNLSFFSVFSRSPSRKAPIESTDEVSFDIVIPNEIGPLGVHVVPCECDTDGRLIVQGIEPGGRIDRDGRLAVYDCIVAINGYPLQVSF